MLALYIIAPTIICLFGFYRLEDRAWLRKHRHARCLSNIARLEHELGIAENPDSPFQFKPGAVWMVNDPRDFQFLQLQQHRQSLERFVMYGGEM